MVVTPKIKQRNAYGEWDRVPGTPVTVAGVMVQPFEASGASGAQNERSALGGPQADSQYRVTGRGPWPGGTHSEVAWNGRIWDQVGEAKVYSVSRRTSHFDARIEVRTAEVK